MRFEKPEGRLTAFTTPKQPIDLPVAKVACIDCMWYEDGLCENPSTKVWDMVNGPTTLTARNARGSSVCGVNGALWEERSKPPKTQWLTIALASLAVACGLLLWAMVR